MKILKAVSVLLILIVVIFTFYCLVRGFNPLSFFKEPIPSKTPLILQYKETSKKSLEINLYEPTRKVFRKSPLIIYIHGGSWKSGNHILGKKELEIVQPLRDFGFTVASVQYRLTSETDKFPNHINDVTDAIRYLHSNASTFGIDQKRFCGLGASAGAHLALLAAFAQDEFFESQNLKHIKYSMKSIVAISTPSDFVDLSCYEGDDLIKTEKLLKDLLGFTYDEAPDLYKSASPISYIGKSKTSILMIHGDKDFVVPIAQGDNYYTKAKEYGMKINYIQVINATHELGSYDGGPIIPEQDELLRELVLFLLKNLI